MPEMKTLTCPGPPEHEFQIPAGRGRPPRYCPEHKPNQAKKSKPEGESKVAEQTAARARPGKPASSDPPPTQGTPRPRPGAPKVESDPERVLDTAIQPGDDPADVPTPDATRTRMPPLGRPDTGSRAKADSAAARNTANQTEEAALLGIGGRPMAKIEFAVSELIPTGQYANVAVGPVRITAYVDLDRDVEGDEKYFTADERSTLVKAANELADMAMLDVIGVQRNLVLESLQSENGS